METKTALAAAGALALTVTGGVSALFLAMDNVAAGDQTQPAVEMVEYVDQNGNPLPMPAQVMPEVAVSDTAAPPEGADEYEEYEEEGYGEGEDHEEYEEEHHEDHEDEDHEKYEGADHD
ncbi:MAG: hypothetical protein ACR2QE_21470 [Acidimicrobiales bacterium]